MKMETGFTERENVHIQNAKIVVELLVMKLIAMIAQAFLGITAGAMIVPVNAVLMLALNHPIATPQSLQLKLHAIRKRESPARVDLN
jgi:hypothetical protein